MAQGAPTTEPASSSPTHCLRHGYDHGIGRKKAYGVETDGGPRHIPQTYKWHSLLIRDIEDQKLDKVGMYDNSIPLNSHGREYLESC